MDGWVPIGELLPCLADYGVTKSTLFYYRRLKLVPAPLRHGMGRRNGVMALWNREETVRRVIAIRRLQAAGKSLSEIQSTLKETT